MFRLCHRLTFQKIDEKAVRLYQPRNGIPASGDLDLSESVRVAKQPVYRFTPPGYDSDSVCHCAESILVQGYTTFRVVLNRIEARACKFNAPVNLGAASIGSKKAVQISTPAPLPFADRFADWRNEAAGIRSKMFQLSFNLACGDSILHSCRFER